MHISLLNDHIESSGHWHETQMPAFWLGFAEHAAYASPDCSHAVFAAFPSSLPPSTNRKVERIWSKSFLLSLDNSFVINTNLRCMFSFVRHPKTMAFIWFSLISS